MRAERAQRQKEKEPAACAANREEVAATGNQPGQERMKQALFEDFGPAKAVGARDMPAARSNG